MGAFTVSFPILISNVLKPMTNKNVRYSQFGRRTRLEKIRHKFKLFSVGSQTLLHLGLFLDLYANMNLSQATGLAVLFNVGLVR